MKSGGVCKKSNIVGGGGRGNKNIIMQDNNYEIYVDKKWRGEEQREHK